MEMRQIPMEAELLIAHSGCNGDRDSLASNNSSHRKIVVRGLCQNRYLICASVLASIGGILFGYDMGVISGAMTQLRTIFNLTCFQEEMIVSAVIIGAFVTSLFAGFLLDFFGRKVTIIASSVFYAIGAIITACAPSYGILFFGRLILGTAISLSSASECVYVSEISPAQYRGTLVSFNELGITVGFLLAYCSNAIFASDFMSGWRWMFGVSLIFAFIMVTVVLFLPYSPRHLLVKGHTEEAKIALAKLRQCDLTSEVLNDEWTAMKSHIYESNTLHSSVSDLCHKGAASYSIFIGFSLMIIQQITGQPNLLFYASTVLESFGFPAGPMASTCTVGIGFAKLLSTIACISVVEKYDRKTFLIAGSVVMSVSLLIISSCAITFNIGVVDSCANTTLNVSDAIIDEPGNLRWVVLTSLIIFVSAYAFSFGPVAWIFLSEIFPTEIRGRAFSWSISLNWAIQLVLSMTFLDFANSSGSVGWPFLLNSALTLTSVGFLYKCIPNTKGKSLESIQDDMKSQADRLFCCN